MTMPLQQERVTTDRKTIGYKFIKQLLNLLIIQISSPNILANTYLRLNLQTVKQGLPHHRHLPSRDFQHWLFHIAHT